MQTSPENSSVNFLSQKQKDQIEQFQPMWKIVLAQFFDHKMAVISLGFITLFISIAVFAPVIKMVTGLDPETQNALNRYQPTMSTTVVSSDEKENYINQFTLEQPEISAQLKKEIFSRAAEFPQLAAASEEDSLTAISKLELPEEKELVQKLKTPGVQKFAKVVKGFETFHVFGTDELGRDVFIRLVYGTQVSMGVGILVAITSTLIGLLIGSIAGYYGGFIDTVLMRFTDSLISLPLLPVLIVVAAIDLNKVPGIKLVITGENENILKLVFILCLFSWMTVALLVRGSILSLREREFILSAKTLGATDATIIIKHMFPNVIAPLLVSVTLGVGESILFEAIMSFLGLGIQQPTPSWGNMLFNAEDLITQAPFLAVLPGLLILITTISFNYLGDGLQDAIDPKAIRR